MLSLCLCLSPGTVYVLGEVFVLVINVAVSSVLIKVWSLCFCLWPLRREKNEKEWKLNGKHPSSVCSLRQAPSHLMSSTISQLSLRLTLEKQTK